MIMFALMYYIFAALVKNVVNVGISPDQRVEDTLSALTTKSSASNLLNDICYVLGYFSYCYGDS